MVKDAAGKWKDSTGKIMETRQEPVSSDGVDRRGFNCIDAPA